MIIAYKPHSSLILTLIFFLSSCNFSSNNQETELISEIYGKTMGTTYSIKFVNPPNFASKEELQKGIDQLLEEINNQMSTYRPNSEITRFNNYQKNDWFPISKNFAYVVSKSLEVSKLSGGAYDPTVGAIVDLWGFGPKKIDKDKIPSAETIESLKKEIGYQKIAIQLNPPAIKKESPHIRIDLSGSAKGFGVDAVALYLQTRQIHDYMVEIGGEIRVKGVKPSKEKWKIAIESPVTQVTNSVQKVINLTDTSLATSGDYRNYFEKEGIRYSHTIDPQTGYPIKHKLASVTIIHPECTVADALATAITVLGPEKGQALVEKLGLTAYLIIKGEGDESPFTDYSSPLFKKYLEI